MLTLDDVVIGGAKQPKPRGLTLDDVQIQGAEPVAERMDDTYLARAVAPQPGRTASGVARDVGVTALKGLQGLQQSIIGLADLTTGGAAGWALERVGIDGKRTQQQLDAMYSPPQQDANRKVREADGFVDTLGAALENPSVIATTVGESVPQMAGGAAIARGVMGLSKAVAPWAAGAIGEGVMGGGSAAESIRQESEDGLLSGKQTMAALGSGGGTALFGAAGGKLMSKFGWGDIDTILARGGPEAIAAGTAKRGFIKQIAASGISEGVFEELPQSVQEQMWQNHALGKPVTEGVGNAAALGMLAGTAMGGAAGGYNSAMQRNMQPGQTQSAPPATPAPAAPTAPAVQPKPLASMSLDDVQIQDPDATSDPMNPQQFGATVETARPQFGAVVETPGPRAIVERPQPRAIVETPGPRGIIENAGGGYGTDGPDIAQVAPQSREDAGNQPAERLPADVVQPAGYGMDPAAGDVAGGSGIDLAAGNAGAVADSVELRDLTEGLIRQMRDAKQLDMDHTLRRAIDRIKAGGVNEKPAYFAKLAKEFEKRGDPKTGGMLNAVATTLKARQKAIPKPVQQKAPKTVKTGVQTADEFSESSRKQFLRMVKQMGGVSTEFAADITGEPANQANRILPGFFSTRGNHLDLVARRLHEAGYITDQEYNDVDGGVERTRELLGQALAKEFVGTPDQQQTLAELEAREADAAAELQSEQERAELAEILGQDVTEADFNALFDGVPDAAQDRADLAYTQEQENDAAETSRIESQAGEAVARGAAAREEGSQGQPGRAPVQGENAGQEARPDLSLAQQTERDLAERERELNRREAEQNARERAALDKEKADRARDDFTLTGSDRASDANAGQGDLLSKPAPDGIGRDGKRQPDRDASKLESSASEFTMQVEADVRGAEAIDAMSVVESAKSWAQDNNINGNQFRQAVYKKMRASDVPVVRDIADDFLRGNMPAKKTVTPQVPTGDMEKYIKVAADSIETLRKVDVYRVLVESNRREFQRGIAEYIKAKRPDLASEVDSVLADDAKPEPATAPITDLGEKIGGESTTSANAGDGHSALFQKTLEAGRRGVKDFSDLLNGDAFLGELDNLLKVPLDPGSMSKAAQAVDGDTTAGKGSLKSVLAHAKALRDILGSDPVLQHGLGGVDAKTQGLVFSHVLGLSENLKVLDSVIQLVPVDVMNNLGSQKLAPDSLFNNPSVFKRAITGNLRLAVPPGDMPDALVRAIALSGAEIGSGRVVPDLVRPAFDNAAAGGTLNGNHGVNDTRNDGQSETDSGIALFSRGHAEAARNTGPVSQMELDAAIERVAAGWKRAQGDGGRLIAVDTVDALPVAILRAADAQNVPKEEIKGVFHNGHIYLVRENHATAKDAEETIFHEAYGHMGALLLNGNDRQKLSAAFNDVWRRIDGLDGVRKMAGQFDVLDQVEPYIKSLATADMPLETKRRVIVDELLAHVAGRGEFTLKEQAKAYVGALRVGLRNAARAMKLDGIAQTLDGYTDSELLWSLKQMRAAVVSGKTGKGNGTLFARRVPAGPNSPQQPIRMQNRPGFTVDPETRAEGIQRRHQDKMNRWAKVQRQIKEQGGTVELDQDVYHAMERMTGRAADRIDQFTHETVRPLLKRIADLNTNFEELGTYLMALGAKDRNDYIQTIRQDMPDNGSGLSNQEAAQIIADYRKRPDFAKFDALARDFQKLTERKLKVLVGGGVISQQQATDLTKAFGFYVPFKGFETIDEDGNRAGGTGAGYSTPKRFTKQAFGRVSKAGQVVENIIRDYEQAVILAEKANVGRYVRNLAQANPDPSLWTVDQPASQPSLVNGHVQMRQATFDNENEIRFIEGGKEVRIQLHDPLLAQTYNNLGQEPLSFLMKAGDTLNRFLRQTYTQKNPAFILVNAVRDVQTGLALMTAEMGATAATKAMRHMAGAFKAAGRESRKRGSVTGEWAKYMDAYRKSGAQTAYYAIEDIEAKQTKLHELMAREGGGGFMWAWKQHGVKGLGKMALYRSYNNAVVDVIESLNGGFENMMRLSAFRQYIDDHGGIDNPSRETLAEASRIAKNLTVNFNRKGEKTRGLNALYLFWNANVQGTQNLYRAAMSSAHKGQVRAAIGGMVGLGFLMAMATDEEDDELTPDHLKDTSLVFHVGDGHRIQIPLAYGLGAFVAMGYEMGMLTKGARTPARSAMNLLATTLQHFSPLGNPVHDGEADMKDVAVAGMPTILKVPTMLATNRNGMGYDVVPKFDDEQPDRPAMRNATRGGVFDKAAGGLEYVGLDVSPESLKLASNFLTGGLGTFLSDSATAMMVGSKGEFDAEKTPIVKRFYGENDVEEYRSRFYEQANDVKQQASAQGKKQREFFGSNKARDSVMDYTKQMKELRAQESTAQDAGKPDAAERIQAKQIKLSDAFKREHDRMVKRGLIER